MTIALGILGRDFVVIGADTEGTIGDTKFEDHKIDAAFHLAEEGNKQVVMTGAGNSHMMEAFMGLVGDKVLRDPRLKSDPLAVFDQAIERFYVAKVIPLVGFGGNCPDFSIVIGFRNQHRVSLFLSEFTAFINRRSFAVAGLGKIAAIPILSRLVGPHGAVKLDQAIMAASYAINHAKESVSGVGKQTDIRYLTADGTFATVLPDDQVKIDAAISRYDRDHGVAAFNAMAGFWSPDRAARHLQAVRDEIADTLKHYPTPVSRREHGPVTPPTRKSPKRK